LRVAAGTADGLLLRVLRQLIACVEQVRMVGGIQVRMLVRMRMRVVRMLVAHGIHVHGGCCSGCNAGCLLLLLLLLLVVFHLLLVVIVVVIIVIIVGATIVVVVVVSLIASGGAAQRTLRRHHLAGHRCR